MRIKICNFINTIRYDSCYWLRPQIKWLGLRLAPLIFIPVYLLHRTTHNYFKLAYILHSTDFRFVIYSTYQNFSEYNH